MERRVIISYSHIGSMLLGSTHQRQREMSYLLCSISLVVIASAGVLSLTCQFGITADGDAGEIIEQIPNDPDWNSVKTFTRVLHDRIRSGGRPKTDVGQKHAEDPQKEEGTPATTEQSDEQEHVAEEGNGDGSEGQITATEETTVTGGEETGGEETGGEETGGGETGGGETGGEETGEEETGEEGARKKRVPDETEESQDLAEETPTQETESPAEAETSGQETNEEPTADSPTTIESETPGTPAEPKTEQECDESESQPFCTRISIFHDGNEKLVAKGCATSIQCSETKCHEHSSAVGYTGEHCCCEEDFCNAGIRKDLTLTLNIFVALLAFFKFLA